jgi:hypothetical protein
MLVNGSRRTPDALLDGAAELKTVRIDAAAAYQSFGPAGLPLGASTRAADFL